MRESNVDVSDEQPVFAAELRPHRSLGKAGFRVVLGICGGVCFLYGAFFLATGAYPVGLFFGLDFLGLYLALTVTRTALSIRKFTPAGRMVEHSFNPFWARFRVKRHEEFGITSMYVTGEGRFTDIGSFLNPDDRESFAKAFRGALATVKRRI
jgi:uncharacterized membrane protein